MNWKEKYLNKVTCGDCLEVMKELPDNSIDLVITSPPYDNLRDYKGYSFDFEDIAKELFRVIKDGGVVVWVVGDSTIDGSETGTSFRQALHFKELGFNLHDTMIYLKNAIPFPASNRYNQIFEYMFVFSKSTIKTFNPLKRKTNYGSHIRKSNFRQKDGSMSMLKSLKVNDESLCGNVWLYETGYMKTTKDESAFEHPAMFPELLAHDHIISWSNENDIVLDPMCGSGTVCKMALKNNRNFIGIEISPEYCKIAEQRIKKEKDQLKLF